MDDLPSLRRAVAGSDVVFAMTNCEFSAPCLRIPRNADAAIDASTLVWEKASAALEIAQGKAIADASVAEGVALLIWSSLPNVTAMTGGKLSGVKHFDSKAAVADYIRGLPIESAFYMPAFYMQNMTSLFKPTRVNSDPFSAQLMAALSMYFVELPRHPRIHCTLESNHSPPANRHRRHGQIPRTRASRSRQVQRQNIHRSHSVLYAPANGRRVDKSHR